MQLGRRPKHLHCHAAKGWKHLTRINYVVLCDAAVLRSPGIAQQIGKECRRRLLGIGIPKLGCSEVSQYLLESLAMIRMGVRQQDPVEYRSRGGDREVSAL